MCYLGWNPAQKQVLDKNKENPNQVGTLVNNNVSVLTHSL